MRNRFDLQLDSLEESLHEMGHDCCVNITTIMDALVNRSEKKAREVVSASMRIRRSERNIESICLKLLLQQQPVARDLRIISSGLKSVYDLERIGDVTGDIANLILKDNVSIASDILGLNEMGKAAETMVKDAVKALTEKDEALARKVIDSDDIVDEFFIKAKKKLSEDFARTETNMEYALNLLMIAKYFEKIGDHAVNIAKWAIFCATGELPENEDQ
ncbi:MAG: phosphate signaling complex protein PhoU [Bulleidia sp.]